MPFITQGKANIKYLLIVVLVATIAGGIIFAEWNYYQKEIVNLNSFTKIKMPERKEIITNFNECIARGYPILEFYPRQCKNPDGKTFFEEILPTPTEAIKTEEKISDNGLKVIIKSSDNQRWLALVENGKEKIINSCLISDADLARICTYSDLSLSPQKNYLIYSKLRYERGSIILYNLKTEEIKEFDNALRVGFTDDEKYLFVCVKDDFGGTYYGKVYNNKSLEEIYSVPEEYSHGIGKCGYDSNRKVIFFNSIDDFKPIDERIVYVIDYDPETNKANVTNYKYKE